MRAFLTTLAVSTVSAIVLWNFGLARMIWPAHALLATILVAALCGAAVQLIMSEDNWRKHSQDNPT
jgi:hypothetical protein